MGTLNVVESVFLTALEQPNVEARAAYLDQACAGDENLRRCVERLLNAHPRADGFMQEPAAGLPVTVDHAPLAEKPGTHIGPYKLLQELGEGGFGVVFLAEQSEPVRRKVALKVIRPGMDSRQVVARFEQERQALALMDHPNIAKVLDGGTTESGRPFFVMELVKGVPITQFCDDNRLSPRERLGLFVGVCEAIQHAHTKGVIHRDIKPSNVLVALVDGRPVPKVIDFGVAKAIAEPLTDKTLFTRHGQVIGTLEYMSPEQATLDQHDIDTRSDVYALGVLLYELLTGSTPLDREKLRSSAFAEMLRLIREEEPPRPSVRLSGSGLGLPLLAAYRKTDSQKLPKLVRGELDWIAMKALEKDRSRRYQSALGLAEDVGRYLRDEPVCACPPSLLYRVSKFARKNRAAFTLAGTVAVLLLLGAIVSTWQAVRATRAEGRAVLKADEADEARERAEREAEAHKAAREELRRNQYGLAMSLVRTAWDSDNISRAVELLQQQRPGPGEEDLRGFEWHYYDRQLHQQRRTIELGDGKLWPVLSGDGSRVAYWRAGQGEEYTLEVMEIGTKEVLFSRKMKRNGNMALSFDGRVVWFQTDIKTVHVVDMDSGKEQVFSNRYFGELTPDGKRLIWLEVIKADVGNAQPFERGASVVAKSLNLNALDAEPIVSGEFHSSGWRLGQKAFSADGTRMVLPPGRGGRSTNIQVWDFQRKRWLKQEGKVEPGNVSALAFSPDGTRLATVGIGATASTGGRSRFVVNVSLWDCTGETLRLLRTTQALERPNNSSRYELAYSPDGRRLAVWVPSEAVHILDAATGSKVQVVRSPSLPIATSFSKDGTRLFMLASRARTNATQKGRKAGQVWLEWDVKPWPVKSTPVPDRVVRSRDGARQAVYPRFNQKTVGPPTISILDREGKKISTFRGHPENTVISTVQFSSDARLVYSRATGGLGNFTRITPDYRIWEAKTGKEVWSYQAKPLEATESRRFEGYFSYDDRLAVLPGPKGGTVFRFKEGLRELFSVGALTDATFSRDGRLLVTTRGELPYFLRSRAAESKVESLFWDVESGRQIHPFPTRGPAVVSSDRRLILRHDPEGGLAVYDSKTMRKRCTLRLDFFARLEFLCSPDKKRMISFDTFGRGNDTPIVWDLTTGRELYRLESLGGRMARPSFSYDGKRIAAAAFDWSNAARVEVMVWDAATGRELLSFGKGYAGGTNGAPRVRFSEDGHKLILTGRWSGFTTVFDATPRRERE